MHFFAWLVNRMIMMLRSITIPVNKIRRMDTTGVEFDNAVQLLRSPVHSSTERGTHHDTLSQERIAQLRSKICLIDRLIEGARQRGREDILWELLERRVAVLDELSRLEKDHASEERTA